jgi:hypothetical protein
MEETSFSKTSENHKSYLKKILIELTRKFIIQRITSEQSIM